MGNFQDKVGFIKSVAELLRGDYKESEYGKVVLPLTVLRRLDCVLEPTKAKVLAKANALPANADEAMKELMICQAAGQMFYNLSKFTFTSLLADQDNLAANLNHYINSFSVGAREIFTEKFRFGDQINRLDEANLLYLVMKRFTTIDLHPDAVDNIEMGYVFEELIRWTSELSNETAGHHFTPREVIRLMVNVLFIEDDDALRKKGVIRTLYDPACGTGGMLSVAENYLRELNPSATLKTFGQELNAESYGVCKGDMLIKGEDASNIKFGNSFTQDGLRGERFNYFLSNPPFGVEWKKIQQFIDDEHEKLGFGGRFGAGLPRISDGSFLFLQHMIAKFKDDGTGSRLAIVFNGSPLFTGSAGSGESEIRRWIIENDWLEAIIALPDQLFYNTGISTYVWVVTNRKNPRRKGKIQLVNAVSFFRKMRKSLGDKRNEISPEQIAEITRIYGDFQEGPNCKIFDNSDFGYWRITVERPLRLNFAVTPERLERVQATSAFVSLAEGTKPGRGRKAAKHTAEGNGQASQTTMFDDGKEEPAEAENPGHDQQRAILSMLKSLATLGVIKNREEFSKKLKKAIQARDLVLPPPLFKAILTSLSERDETAELCRDAKGNPETDPDLRDNENVPLEDDIHSYLKREVLPHVPDAWIDETRTKKGYEIPITRHFYEFTPLRSLHEIEVEITSLESEIQDMLTRVLT
jgi:type I restriction enzyme M protein